MSERRLLIDNDAFLLLAGAGQLEQTTRALGFSLDDAKRLDSLPYMIQRSKSMRKRFEPVILSRALAACSVVDSFNERPTTRFERVLSENASIDEGEAVLYGLLADHPNYMLLSNDKRAMREIGLTPELAELRQIVAGRVICLEEVVQRLFELDGHYSVCQALSPVKNCDTVLTVLLTDLNIHDEGQFRVALDSYLRHLHETVGTGFLRIASN